MPCSARSLRHTTASQCLRSCCVDHTAASLYWNGVRLSGPNIKILNIFRWLFAQKTLELMQCTFLIVRVIGMLYFVIESSRLLALTATRQSESDLVTAGNLNMLSMWGVLAITNVAALNGLGLQKGWRTGNRGRSYGWIQLSTFATDLTRLVGVALAAVSLGIVECAYQVNECLHLRVSK